MCNNKGWQLTTKTLVNYVNCEYCEFHFEANEWSAYRWTHVKMIVKLVIFVLSCKDTKKTQLLQHVISKKLTLITSTSTSSTSTTSTRRLWKRVNAGLEGEETMGRELEELKWLEPIDMLASTINRQSLLTSSVLSVTFGSKNRPLPWFLIIHRKPSSADCCLVGSWGNWHQAPWFVAIVFWLLLVCRQEDGNWRRYWEARA